MHTSYTLEITIEYNRVHLILVVHYEYFIARSKVFVASSRSLMGKELIVLMRRVLSGSF